MPDRTPVVHFHAQIETRDGSLGKDARNVNAYAESTPEGMMMVKRPGLVLADSHPAGTAQGTFFFGGQGWSIINNTARAIGGGTAIAIPSAGSASAQFDSLQNALNPLAPTTLLHSADGLWVFNGVTATKVTDADYPSSTLPGVCELDGTFYVMQTTTGRIFGSAVGDPTSWDALNFIGAGVQMGTGVAVHRHLNYVLGFYSNGLQAFYDNNNPTGSPLSPAGNASWLTGCASGASVVELNDVTFFLSRTAQNGIAVSMLEGLQLGIVSTPFVEKVLNAADLTGLRAMGLRVAGHPFYLLSIPAAAVTLAYDALMKRWDCWSSRVGGVDTAFAGCNYLPSNAGGSGWLQDPSSGAVYSLTESALDDAGQPIVVKLRTRAVDWGTRKRKFFGEGLLLADTVASTLTESHSDDDYQTWSTPRTIDLASDKKMLQRNGSARSRAFELVHAASTPLRVWGLEFEVEAGAG